MSASSSSEKRTRLPNHVAGYEKIRTVGKGSFGSAVLYRRKDDDSLVIIKETNITELSQNERQLALNEVNLLANLDHPNIISYYDSFYQEGVLMIEMEYAEGGTLAQLLSRQLEFLQESEIMYLFEQMISAVTYLHDNNVLHRDLKTANIFLTKDNLIKIGDFGISKMMGTETKNLGANTILGTPYYLSPEMCEGKTYNEKSDVWALGCCLYEMTCLQKPFDGTSLPALVRKIVHAEYEQVKGAYSSDLKLLIREMLNTNPVQRPSAGDVLKAVQKHGALIKRKPVFLENNVTQRPRGCHSALYQFSIEQVTLTAVPEIPPDLNVKQLIVAKSHFLLLTTDSQVFSWGENTHGQLGHGDRKYRSIPSKIDALQGRDIQKIAAGANFSVFCADHGIVLICGHRDFVGSNNDTQDLLNPQLIDGLLRENIVDISCGDEHAVAISEGGQVFVWGNNVDGRLGTGNRHSVNVPQQIEIPTKQLISNVKCGPDCTMLITVSGTVMVMGNNRYNKLNINNRMGFFANVNKNCDTDIEKIEKPTPLKPFPSRVVDASLGWSHSGVLLENGHVHLFGCNLMGEMGNGNRQPIQCWMVYRPVKTLVSCVCVQLICGKNFTMVATSDNQLFFWGSKVTTDSDNSDKGPTEKSKHDLDGKKKNSMDNQEGAITFPTLVMRLDAARTTNGKKPFIKLSTLACHGRNILVTIDTSPVLIECEMANQSNSQLTTGVRRRSAPELAQSTVKGGVSDTMVSSQSNEQTWSFSAEQRLKTEIESLKKQIQEQNNTFKGHQDQMTLLHQKLSELQHLQRQSAERHEPPPAYHADQKPKTLRNPFLPEAKTRICSIS